MDSNHNLKSYAITTAATVPVGYYINKHLKKGISLPTSNEKGYNFIRTKIRDNNVNLLVKNTEPYKKEFDKLKKLPTILRKLVTPKDSYMPKIRTIISTSKINENAHILAHEYGHSKIHDKLPFLLNARKLGTQIAGATSLLAVTALTDGYFLKTKKQKAKDSMIKNPYIILPTITAAAQAPELYDEYKASKIGLDTMKESKAFSPRELKQAKTALTKAFGTYGTKAVILTASPIIALKVKQYFHDKKKSR